MPATNDINEGALGAFHNLMRHQPQLTLLGHNALKMYFTNNTQAFMAANFTQPEDYQFLHQMARESIGEERKQKQELVKFQQNHHAAKLAKREEAVQKKKENADQLANTLLVLDKEKVAALKGQALKDQLKLFQHLDAPNLAQIKQTTKVSEI
jgi:hypothetical protein